MYNQYCGCLEVDGIEVEGRGLGGVAFSLFLLEFNR